eukprot:scaffold298_cov247-Pinguiococcus_pyrenoidosus.AAC.13
MRRHRRRPDDRASAWHVSYQVWVRIEVPPQRRKPCVLGRAVVRHHFLVAPGRGQGEAYGIGKILASAVKDVVHRAAHGFPGKNCGDARRKLRLGYDVPRSAREKVGGLFIAKVERSHLMRHGPSGSRAAGGSFHYPSDAGLEVHPICVLRLHGGQAKIRGKLHGSQRRQHVGLSALQTDEAPECVGTSGNERKAVQTVEGLVVQPPRTVLQEAQGLVHGFEHHFAATGLVPSQASPSICENVPKERGIGNPNADPRIQQRFSEAPIHGDRRHVGLDERCHDLGLDFGSDRITAFSSRLSRQHDGPLRRNPRAATARGEQDLHLRGGAPEAFVQHCPRPAVYVALLREEMQEVVLEGEVLLFGALEDAVARPKVPRSCASGQEPRIAGTDDVPEQRLVPCRSDVAISCHVVPMPYVAAIAAQLEVPVDVHGEARAHRQREEAVRLAIHRDSSGICRLPELKPISLAAGQMNADARGDAGPRHELHVLEVRIGGKRTCLPAAELIADHPFLGDGIFRPRRRRRNLEDKVRGRAPIEGRAQARFCLGHGNGVHGEGPIGPQSRRGVPDARLVEALGLQAVATPFPDLDRLHMLQEKQHAGRLAAHLHQQRLHGVFIVRLARQPAFGRLLRRAERIAEERPLELRSQVGSKGAQRRELVLETRDDLGMALNVQAFPRVGGVNAGQELGLRVEHDHAPRTHEHRRLGEVVYAVEAHSKAARLGVFARRGLLERVPNALNALEVPLREHRGVVREQRSTLEARHARLRQRGGAMTPLVQAEFHRVRARVVGVLQDLLQNRRAFRIVPQNLANADAQVDLLSEVVSKGRHAAGIARSPPARGQIRSGLGPAFPSRVPLPGQSRPRRARERGGGQLEEAKWAERRDGGAELIKLFRGGGTDGLPTFSLRLLLNFAI